MIDAFVIDYVFDHASLIAETMEELGATNMQGLRSVFSAQKPPTLPRSLLKFGGGHSSFRLLPDRTLRV